MQAVRVVGVVGPASARVRQAGEVAVRVVGHRVRWVAGADRLDRREVPPRVVREGLGEPPDLGGRLDAVADAGTDAVRRAATRERGERRRVVRERHRRRRRVDDPLARQVGAAVVGVGGRDDARRRLVPRDVGSAAELDELALREERQEAAPRDRGRPRHGDGAEHSGGGRDCRVARQRAAATLAPLQRLGLVELRLFGRAVLVGTPRPVKTAELVAQAVEVPAVVAEPLPDGALGRPVRRRDRRDDPDGEREVRPAVVEIRVDVCRREASGRNVREVGLAGELVARHLPERVRCAAPRARERHLGDRVGSAGELHHVDEAVAVDVEGVGLERVEDLRVVADAERCRSRPGAGGEEAAARVDRDHPGAGARAPSRRVHEVGQAVPRNVEDVVVEALLARVPGAKERTGRAVPARPRRLEAGTGAEPDLPVPAARIVDRDDLVGHQVAVHVEDVGADRAVAAVGAAVPERERGPGDVHHRAEGRPEVPANLPHATKLRVHRVRTAVGIQVDQVTCHLTGLDIALAQRRHAGRPDLVGAHEPGTVVQEDTELARAAHGHVVRPAVAVHVDQRAVRAAEVRPRVDVSLDEARRGRRPRDRRPEQRRRRRPLVETHLPDGIRGRPVARADEVGAPVSVEVDEIALRAEVRRAVHLGLVAEPADLKVLEAMRREGDGRLLVVREAARCVLTRVEPERRVVRAEEAHRREKREPVRRARLPDEVVGADLRAVGARDRDVLEVAVELLTEPRSVRHAPAAGARHPAERHLIDGVEAGARVATVRDALHVGLADARLLVLDVDRVPVPVANLRQVPGEGAAEGAGRRTDTRRRDGAKRVRAAAPVVERPRVRADARDETRAPVVDPRRIRAVGERRELGHSIREDEREDLAGPVARHALAAASLDAPDRQVPSRPVHVAAGLARVGERKVWLHAVSSRWDLDRDARRRSTGQELPLGG